MDVYAYDIETYKLEPTAVFHFISLAAFTEGKIVLHKGTAPKGVFIGELKAFALDLKSSWGINYRHYNLITNIPSNMVEYLRVTQGDIVLNAHNGTVTSVPFTSTIELPFTFCEKGYKFSATAGQCTECTLSGCEYCEVVKSDYSDLCRK